MQTRLRKEEHSKRLVVRTTANDNGVVGLGRRRESAPGHSLGGTAGYCLLTPSRVSIGRARYRKSVRTRDEARWSWSIVQREG